MSSQHDLQQEIRQAVNNLPSLFTNTKKRSSRPKTPHDFINDQYHRAQRTKKQLVWVGVSIIVVLIAALWALNISSLAKNVLQAPSTEKQLIAEGSEQIKDILSGKNSVLQGPDKFTKLIDKTDSEDGIKSTLQNLVLAISNAEKVNAVQITSSTTSTNDTTTNTSTIISTSTL